MIDRFRVHAGNDEFSGTARDVLIARIEERSDARCRPDASLTVSLALDATGEDRYRIEDAPGGVSITGGSRSGLLAGIGTFLRASQYDGEGFTPSAWRGESTAAGDMRGIYFATHFQNWYEMASDAEIQRYVEDLALWGMNHLMIAFPMMHLTGWDDPGADVFFNRLATYRRICHRLGIKIGSLYVPNHDFRVPRAEFANTPNRDDFGRKGDHGNNICPSKPGATEYALQNYDEFLKRLQATPLDFAGYWPYDEGGCGCDDCFPWGGNGYLRLAREMAERARAAMPGVKLVLSTWVFDTPEAGEWEALSQSMREHGPWVDYILADAHEDFPRYPLDVEVPGGVTLINFPEISMWGLGPWGGYGASPLPARFQRLWDQVRHVVRGGFPYSEGIYEDINKAIELQFYWNPGQSAEDTVRAYAAYEYTGADTEAVLGLIRGIEANHVTVASGEPPDLDLAEQVVDAARRIDATLSPYAQASWRWRILYLRALLDRERFAAAYAAGKTAGADWGALLAENETAQEHFRELMRIYHSREVIDEAHPQHAWVRPPIRQ